MNVLLIEDELKISLSLIDFFSFRHLLSYLCHKNPPLLPFLNHRISRLLCAWYLLHPLGLPIELMRAK